MGRSIAAVAADSYALTLWTFAHLRQIDRHQEVERLGERVDLASMIAIGFHKPEGLERQEMRYLKAAGVLCSMTKRARERGERLLVEYEKAQARARAQATPPESPPQES